MKTHALTYVFDGWDGYARSIAEAIRPLTPDQLDFSGDEEMRTVGELAWHIAHGRVDWFGRMGVAGCSELAVEMEAMETPEEAVDLVEWLDRTWRIVQSTLEGWTVDDLAETYRQPYQDKVYAVSRQWVVWRVMTHDVHHGGQLSELLALQGILPLELTLLGGHLTVPPLAE
ncbi:hypothetical protein BH11ARM2_BH11ARM2_00150 [soil metagenome]